jgi:capsular polysaccharide biosynthesis protein
MNHAEFNGRAGATRMKDIGGIPPGVSRGDPRSVHGGSTSGPGMGSSLPPEPSEGEYILHGEYILQTIRRRLWVILIAAAALTVAAVALSLLQTPRYEASIRILIGQEQGITETPGDVDGLQQLTLTMTEAIGTRPVAEDVIEELSLQATPEELLENLTVEQAAETQFIEVSYQDPDPESARRIANAIGDEFSIRVSEVSSDANAITATVWEEAATPDEPVSPNPVRNGALALLLGGVLGLGIAILLEYLDDSWRSPEEAEQISGVPTFGLIPEFKTAPGKAVPEKAVPGKASPDDDRKMED